MNPRDTFAPYSLSRGAPSPLGYFSKINPYTFLPLRPYQDDWRRGWDSNPRALSDKRFSRPPRYDHFDTSPRFNYFVVLRRHGLFYHTTPSPSIPFFIFYPFLSFPVIIPPHIQYYSSGFCPSWARHWHSPICILEKTALNEESSGEHA